MDFMSLFNMFLIMFSAYLLASAAGLISERSGTVNISIEGTMVIGAAFYTLLMNERGFDFGSIGIMGPIYSMLIASVVGMAYSSILALATATFKGNHVVAGTALNMMAPVIILIINFAVMGSTSQIASPIITIYNDYYPLIIMAIVAFVILAIWFILSKTSIGLRLKTAGENPYALETAGKSANKVRFITILFAGLLAGMSGAVIRMLTLVPFYGSVFGAGFIAIAILIFGQWKMQGIILGSLIISILMSIISVSINEWAIGWVQEYANYFRMIPFVIPIISLVFMKVKVSPKALGKPFNKSER